MIRPHRLPPRGRARIGIRAPGQLSVPARLSLLGLLATALFTAVHHLYRFGLPLLLPALVLVVLPIVLVFWADRTHSHVARGAYTLYGGLLIVWFGYIDGGLDHALRLINRVVLAPAFGGASPLGGLDFRLLPPSELAGDRFYEATGILAFIASTIATYYLGAFLRAALRRVPSGSAAAAHDNGRGAAAGAHQ
jgi:hypothetical protein